MCHLSTGQSTFLGLSNNDLVLIGAASHEILAIAPNSVLKDAATLTTEDIIDSEALIRATMLRLMDLKAPGIAASEAMYVILNLQVPQLDRMNFRSLLLPFDRETRIFLFGVDFTDFCESAFFISFFGMLDPLTPEIALATYKEWKPKFHSKWQPNWLGNNS